MKADITAQFSDPITAANYLGENIGTHYSAALRAAEAYGKYLAAERELLLLGNTEGGNLGNFWRDLIRSEQLRIGSPKVLRELSTTPSHYFSDFLDTADDVYRKRYQDVPPAQRKKPGQTQHAQCLQLLRDHIGAGMQDHFTVRNQITTWMQMIRIMGVYQE